MPGNKLAEMHTNPHNRKGATATSVDNVIGIVDNSHTVRTTLRAAFQVVLSP
jgi:hypothetical protein